MKQFKIAVIAGDGIGPEVINEGIKVLKKWLNWIQVFNWISHTSHGAANFMPKMVE